MTERDILKHELDYAKKAVAALPAWKREVIRRTREAEVTLGYISSSWSGGQNLTERGNESAGEPEKSVR